MTTPDPSPSALRWMVARQRLQSAGREAWPQVCHVASRARELGTRARARSAPALGTLTVLGWTVLGLALVAWVAGALLGWHELLVITATCLLALILAGGWVIGRTSVEVTVSLDPPRVVAGDPSAGEVRFRNRAGRRSLPLRVDLPVGPVTASFDVSSLEAGGEAAELLVIPTERRGVIPVGPATSVRGDPVGLLQRRATSGEPSELLVHPRTVALPSFGTGLLRDLEGRTTDKVSVSDLAFHSIREYEPGDDRRYVHWRSTAKAGRLLVRQFLDTRRSALAVIVDGTAPAYGDADELEVALQAAGSLVVRAVTDELDTVLVAGRQAVSGGGRHHLLDALARVEPADGTDLATLASRVAARESATTLAVLVGGTGTSAADLQRAAARFAPEVRLIGIRVAPAEKPGIATAGRVVVLTLRDLGDLPGLVAVEGTA